jgi:hypothetical protein
MSEIPTLKKYLFSQMGSNGNQILAFPGVSEYIIKFTQLHVEAALKAASEKDDTDYVCRFSDEEIAENLVKGIKLWQEDFETIIDKQSILTAYPKELIK